MANKSKPDSLSASDGYQGVDIVSTKKPDNTRRCLTAVRKGLPDVVTSLLDAGADPNGRDDYNLTLLMWAARRGHTEVIDVLLRRGALPDLTDNTKATALHHAALFHRLDAVKHLIVSGATVDAKQMHGCTAFDLAKADDQFEIARVLLSAGASGSLPELIAPPEGQRWAGIAIGSVGGGNGPGTTVFAEKSRVMKAFYDRAEEIGADRRELLGVILFDPGRITSDFGFTGIRRAVISRKYKRISYDVLIPKEFHEMSDLAVRIVALLREVVEMADLDYKKARFVFDKAAHLRLVDEVEQQIREEDLPQKAQNP